jgi:hypothetical protein
MEYSGQLVEKAPKYQALRQFFPGMYDSTLVNAMTSVDPMRRLYSGCVVRSPAAVTRGAPRAVDADFHYVGFPAVVSPRAGDIVVVAHRLLITTSSSSLSTTTTTTTAAAVPLTVNWTVAADGTDLGLMDVYLWKDAYCGAAGATSDQYGGALLGKVASSVRYTDGVFTADLGADFSQLSYDSTASYFLELRAGVHSLFSDFFTMRSDFFTAASSTSVNCIDSSIQEVGYYVHRYSVADSR